MLHNRFAGEALKKVQKLYEAGIEMNGQIVLCKGPHDGPELERAPSGICRTYTTPIPQGVSIVPVGLTRCTQTGRLIPHGSPVPKRRPGQ